MSGRRRKERLYQSQTGPYVGEIKRKNKANLMVGGFYREWTRHNNSSKESQLESIKILTQQIIEATSTNKPTVILGDANLCMNKWDDDTHYTHKDVANELKGTLAVSRLKPIDLGMTYLADRLTPDGDIIESAMDHTYISEELAKEKKMKTSQESSSDHVPIMAEMKDEKKPKRKYKILYKRSMRDFINQRWKDCLIQKRWEKLGETKDIEEMTRNFTNLVMEALEEFGKL